jgi:hypothetical protein
MKKFLSVVLAILLPACLAFGVQQTILSTDQVKDALLTKCQSNFTELYNYINGTSSPTLLTPTVASFVNANHTHASAAQGGTLTSPVLGGTATGTYTLGGTPTVSAPVLSGTVTGTYTLGGTPTITVAAWTDFTPGGANWTVATQCSYKKDPMGFVHLKGALSGATNSNSTVYNALPSGYRPSQTTYFFINTSGTIQTGNISTGGVISVDISAITSTIILDGITFVGT